MDYQVWTKDEYVDTYTKVECGDLGAAKREIDQAYKRGLEPILTIVVPYSLAIKVEPVGAEKPQETKLTKAILKRQQEDKGIETSQDKTE